ncbi:conjugative transfer signal peptidase TraF [Fusobacterium animalis 7_1]|jgi:hypothetical protein|uniref:Conjugative transfer signal peptidase TraF n=1 Tax=Fusobacterium animalis 7_1 TaxID=457405 RepID=A0A140PSL7_9FUSO|nr:MULTISPECIES: S26 family signal peptidase [Fusobacterium]EEO42890.1 conjugative transfer signal peptidase TraF [Fusobacterium animalis 7_1]EPC08400.1 conjugative transfer signal peptidase TraF [Fusobacterium polymorphum F0401]
MEKLQKSKRKFRKLIIAIWVFIFIVLGTVFIFRINNYILNISQSLPIGIYQKIDSYDYKIDDYVIVKVPEEYKEFIYSRGYMGTDELSAKTMLKKIKGINGDSFEVIEGSLIKNNTEIIAKVLSKDSKGRNLPKISKITLKNGEYFLLGEHPYSLDSRYLGKFEEKDILYKVRPIITF